MEIDDWQAAGEIGETAAVALKWKLLGMTVTEYENGVLAGSRRPSSGHISSGGRS